MQKMTFWITITMLLKTYLTLSHNTPRATLILFHLKLIESISLQNEWNLFQSKEMVNMNPCWCASWTYMSSVKVLVFEITMTCIRKSKELQFYCIIFKKHTVDLFMNFFFYYYSCLFLQNNKTIHKLKAYKKSI